MEWTGGNFEEIKVFTRGNCEFLQNELLGRETLVIKTREGGHIADRGDHILEDTEGGFYACKPDHFGKAYSFAKPEGFA